MKKLKYLLILFSVLGFSQNKKLGIYSTLEANFGFDLAWMIRDSQAKTDYEKSQLEPGKFSYGSTFIVGFQPLKYFSLGGGFKYSFVTDGFHVIYYVIQPKIFLSDPEEDDPVFLNLNFGKKINNCKAESASFGGISIGKTEILNKHFGHQFSLNLESQVINKQGTLFVGLSYGILIFSNKKYQ